MIFLFSEDKYIHSIRHAIEIMTASPYISFIPTTTLLHLELERCRQTALAGGLLPLHRHLEDILPPAQQLHFVQHGLFVQIADDIIKSDNVKNAGCS